MFRTELIPDPLSDKINLRSPVLLLGSCFTEYIGLKMIDFKFDTLLNPFGVIYNPVSLYNCIDISLQDQVEIEEGIIENQGTYRHWDFHSEVSDVNKKGLVDKVIGQLDGTRSFLNRTDWIIFTFGTAFIYKLIQGNRIVANCHKIPSGRFERTLLSTDEIIDGFIKVYDQIKEIRSQVKFILTVSPVRHIRDTLTSNTVSKSLLRLACEEIASGFDDAYYFPAYEILLDDLRDYRFYKQDMVHPNDQAVEYIWDKFVKACIDEETQQFIRDWEKILKSMKHRPFHPGTEEHKRFLMKTIDEVNRFSNIINVDKELKFLSGQLK